MPIKMRVLYATGKKKIKTIANMIKEQYELGVNSVDAIPPAYSCDKERIVILAISAKGDISDSLRLFCKELTKARAQNIALMLDGDKAAEAKIRATVEEGGNTVMEETLFVNGGFPIFGESVKPEEKTAVMEWVDRVIKNLK